MSVYHAHEFLAVLPGGWKDKTINLFTLTDDGPSELSVVVSRERGRLGEPLERFAEQQIFALMSRLPLFKIHKRADTTLDGAPAVLVDYTWQSPDGKMHMQQVMAVAQTQNVVLVITASSKNELSSRSLAAFQDFLQSFRFRT